MYSEALYEDHHMPIRQSVDRVFLVKRYLSTTEVAGHGLYRKVVLASQCSLRQVAVYTFRPARSDHVCLLFPPGPAPASVRGICSDEDVWEGENQCQSSHLPVEQKVLQSMMNNHRRFRILTLPINTCLCPIFNIA